MEIRDEHPPPSSGPVVSGNCGLNSHLSDLISLAMEPITSEASGHEIDSTTDVLHKITDINNRLAKPKCSNGSTSNHGEDLSFARNEEIVKQVSEMRQVEAEQPVEITRARHTTGALAKL